jgi:quinol monooxygenase YgiN
MSWNSASRVLAASARRSCPPDSSKSHHKESKLSTPVVVTAYFHPAPGQHDQVVEALRPAIAAVHLEPGCELYAIHDAPDGTIVMIEKWTSVRDLDDHGAGEAVRALNASLEGLLASPTEVTRLVPLPAGTEEQGQL